MGDGQCNTPVMPLPLTKLYQRMSRLTSSLRSRFVMDSVRIFAGAITIQEASSVTFAGDMNLTNNEAQCESPIVHPIDSRFRVVRIHAAMPSLPTTDGWLLKGHGHTNSRALRVRLYATLKGSFPWSGTHLYSCRPTTEQNLHISFVCKASFARLAS